MPNKDKIIAAALGKIGLDAWNSGLLEIARWLQAMAECRKRHPGMPDAECKKQIALRHGDYERELRELMDDAALCGNARKIRQLADVLELPRKPQDRLRLEVLSMRLAGGPLTVCGSKVDVGAEFLTKEELAKRAKVDPDHAHKVAKKFGVKLRAQKRGSPKGKRGKLKHRAKK